MSAPSPREAASPRLEWARRQVYALSYLTWYELRQQYSRATLGMLWFLITPLLLLVVYGFIITRIYRVDIPGKTTTAYSLLILCGLMPWLAFSEALGNACLSVVNFPAVVRNSPLPAVFLPTVKVLQSFTGLAFAYTLTLIVAGATGNLDAKRLVVAPFAYVCLLGFTLGVGWFFAALAVYLRDVTQAISTILLLGLFASPVLYTPDMAQGLPHYVHLVIAWNPIAPYLGLLRSVLDGAPLVARDLALAPLVALAALTGGFWFFRRLEPGMADSL